MTLRPDGHHLPVGRHGGYGAAEAVVALHGDAIPAAPQLLARCQVQATQGVTRQMFVVIQHVHPSMPNGRCRMPFARLHRPKRFEVALLQADGRCVRHDARPVGAAEARPRVGKRSGWLRHAFVRHEELADSHVVRLACRTLRTHVCAWFRSPKAPRRVIHVPPYHHRHPEDSGSQRGKGRGTSAHVFTF